LWNRGFECVPRAARSRVAPYRIRVSAAPTRRWQASRRGNWPRSPRPRLHQTPRRPQSSSIARSNSDIWRIESQLKSAGYWGIVTVQRGPDPARSRLSGGYCDVGNQSLSRCGTNAPIRLGRARSRRTGSLCPSSERLRGVPPRGRLDFPRDHPSRRRGRYAGRPTIAVGGRTSIAARRRRVGEKADLFSLGATLFHLLTGGPPVKSSHALSPIQRLMARETKPVPPLSEHCPSAPPELSQLVSRKLDHDPNSRPSSARESGEALVPCQRGGWSDASRPARPCRAHQRRGGRTRWTAIRDVRRRPSAQCLGHGFRRADLDGRQSAAIRSRRPLRPRCRSPPTAAELRSRWFAMSASFQPCQ